MKEIVWTLRLYEETMKRVENLASYFGISRAGVVRVAIQRGIKAMEGEIVVTPEKPSSAVESHFAKHAE